MKTFVCLIAFIAYCDALCANNQPCDDTWVGRLKAQLAEGGVYRPSKHLPRAHEKEIDDIFNTVEFMMRSRARQPASLQLGTPAVRVLQKVLEKRLNDGLVSRPVYEMFHINLVKA